MKLYSQLLLFVFVLTSFGVSAQTMYKKQNDISYWRATSTFEKINGVMLGFSGTHSRLELKAGHHRFTILDGSSFILGADFNFAIIKQDTASMPINISLGVNGFYSNSIGASLFSDERISVIDLQPYAIISRYFQVTDKFHITPRIGYGQYFQFVEDSDTNNYDLILFGFLAYYERFMLGFNRRSNDLASITEINLGVTF